MTTRHLSKLTLNNEQWHCEAAVTETAVDATTVTTPGAPATTTHEDHDHEDEEHDHSGTESLPPSPTESTGCEPHGDHVSPSLASKAILLLS